MDGPRQGTAAKGEHSWKRPNPTPGSSAADLTMTDVAGLGRTGVLVACYLVHALRVSADEAIRRVRARRRRAVQTAVQVAAVHHFEKYLLPQTAVFSIRWV